MTTISVPKELLEQVTIELEHDNDRYMLGRELRALLATAQPAADGELEWTEDDAAACGCNYRDAPCERCWALGWELGAPDNARAAQPQQAVAVTDEVRHVPLYEAVERACGELPEGWAITLQMENGAGRVELYDAEGNQVEDFPTNNERLDYTLNDAVDAALSAHKTGEEE